MLIDFHTHSTASDGALTPAQLLARAQTRGLQYLALTDHDTVAGYLEAVELLPEAAELTLIPGVEFSCRWSGATIHILGLGMDCEHPAMREGLAQLSDAREQRAITIAQRLAKLGYAGALEGAQAVAGVSQIGRPHFATWMVAQGHVADHNAAFDRYLGQGKTGDVKAFWPELAQVTQWIESAGGAAVVAHPLKYRFTGMKLRRLVAAFAEAGGSGIEVISGRQTSDQVAHLQRIAQSFDLEVSIGSDFHREWQHGADLGMEIPRIEGLRGVWERWAVATAS